MLQTAVQTWKCDGYVILARSRSNCLYIVYWYFVLCLKCFIFVSILLTMALQPFVDPWPFLRFRNLTQSIGLLGPVISP
jgi:hypothetical protein